MEPIKPDFSEANKFAVLKRGFRDFWKRRNMEAPDTSWFGDRKKRKEEMKSAK